MGVVEELKAILASKSGSPGIREKLAEVLTEAELMEELSETNRMYAEMSQAQRDAMAGLIKAYSVEIPDVDKRKRLLKDVRRIKEQTYDANVS